MLCKFYGANLNLVFLREFFFYLKNTYFVLELSLFDRDYEGFTSQNPEQVQIKDIF
jgi:hypothetical protein